MTGIERVVARMRALAAELPPEDGVAVFNGVYLAVTEEVARRVPDGGFRDRLATTTLDVLFASRYLDAVDEAAAGRRPPACWRPLFQLRGHPAVRPVQFALAGINAHIGHDLPLALADTCRGLGAEPRDLEGDFHRVGALLVSVEERIREALMPGPDLLDVADPLTHLLGSWTLEAARGAAWAAFRALWALRERPEVAAEFAERVDASVGLVGRCLLTPLGCGGGRDDGKDENDENDENDGKRPARRAGGGGALPRRHPLGQPLGQSLSQSSGSSTGAISS
ncbi:hypothetical protein H340_26771 [Streptomyces mobaraensis NBRC 13819 = DSM 40847]|uniref:Uncharacterized protein n=1 Tax=Streptomyces mobaraensis (strain ATCC 29032 / DSM 40847 / JCM 4168 / NBRC 13819 / NCIMB 11159 / IPCR 16-22) TaxID=1223523 RepID=M3AUW8_STRM1|nr:hypothetical protein H340_26771 [Streptomyces mobaraensis NBRC 13819 = DSM 40847]